MRGLQSLRDQFFELISNSKMRNSRRNRMRGLQSLRDQFFESIASDQSKVIEDKMVNREVRITKKICSLTSKYVNIAI
jgi:hypothetical protein